MVVSAAESAANQLWVLDRTTALALEPDLRLEDSLLALCPNAVAGGDKRSFGIKEACHRDRRLINMILARIQLMERLDK